MKYFYSLIAALFAVMIIAGVATPAYASCDVYDIYETPKDRGPSGARYDRWGDRIDVAESISPNTGSPEFVGVIYLDSDTREVCTP